MRPFRSALTVCVPLLLAAACGPAEDLPTTEPPVEEVDGDADEGGDLERDPEADDGDEVADQPDAAVETVVDGLAGPWGMAFLPDGERLLLTQIGGTVSLLDTTSGDLVDLDGGPQVAVIGQGGLLDVAVDPEFEDTGGWIYLTYAAQDEAGASTTHLARARADLDEASLTDVEELFVAEPYLDSGQHFGSRVEVGDDGMLYVSIGDRGDKDFDDHVSRDTSHTLGSVVRLERDGSVPDDNPFVDDPDVTDEIFSYGHRNIQGMAVHPDTGELWVSEHGEEDGDMLHLLQAGGDYGWPETHTGCRYGTDQPVGGDPFERDDVVDPVFHWECGSGGFPPAGMAFYDGEAFPDWRGQLFVGGLATQELGRFTVDDDQVEQADPLLADEGWRIRDVVVGPQDGALYVAVDGDGAPLVRIVPDDS